MRSVGRLHGPSTFDRTHVLNLALSYDLGGGFHAGGRGMYYTGGPAQVAYPTAALAPPRGPSYLRLDWRFDALSVDLAWTPRFTPDRYIDGQRLGFFDARSGARVGGRDLIDASEPGLFDDRDEEEDA